MPGEGPIRLVRIELSVAAERNDYRPVHAGEVVEERLDASVHRLPITIAPHGVIVAMRDG